MLSLETRGGVPTGGRRRSTSLSRDRGAPAGLGGPGRRPSYLDDVLVDRPALQGLQHVHHRAVLLNAHHPDGHRDGLSSDDGRVQDLRVLHGREGGTCQQAGAPAAAGGVPNPALHPDTCSAPQPSAPTLPAPTLRPPCPRPPCPRPPCLHPVCTRGASRTGPRIVFNLWARGSGGERRPYQHSGHNLRFSFKFRKAPAGVAEGRRRSGASQHAGPRAPSSPRRPPGPGASHADTVLVSGLPWSPLSVP